MSTPTSVRLSQDVQKRLDDYVARHRKHGVQAALVEEAIVRFLDAEEGRGAQLASPPLFLVPLYPRMPSGFSPEEREERRLHVAKVADGFGENPHDARIARVVPGARLEMETEPTDCLAFRVLGLHYKPVGFERVDGTRFVSESGGDPHPYVHALTVDGGSNLLPGDTDVGFSLTNWRDLHMDHDVPLWRAIPLLSMPIVRYPSWARVEVSAAPAMPTLTAAYFRLWLVCAHVAAGAMA